MADLMKERLQEGNDIHLFFGLLTAYPLSVENVILISIHKEDHYVAGSKQKRHLFNVDKDVCLVRSTMRLLFQNINKYLSNYEFGIVLASFYAYSISNKYEYKDCILHNITFC